MTNDQTQEEPITQENEEQMPEGEEGMPAMTEDPGGAMDPEAMKKMMSMMGGGAGGEGGGMDMAAIQQMLAGMGGGGGGMGGMMGGGGEGQPPMALQQEAQKARQDTEAKNVGELDADGYKWEQQSKYGESEITIRFAMEKPVTKKDIKIVFSADEIEVTVAGVELLKGKTFSTTHPDDNTWCIVDKGAELQVMLCPTRDTKWDDVLQTE